MEYSVFRPHPWHGLSAGSQAPRIVNAYIEITPFDTIKYEIDKDSGYLRVDRPQLTSSLPPALYGFIPKTYCGSKIAKLAKCKKGDGDPLDILVMSERGITKNEVIVPARVIGGLRMADKGEADDKIIAVLESDPYYEDINDLKDLSPVHIRRIEHYFSTYKLLPNKTQPVLIQGKYGRNWAQKVIEAALSDYYDLLKASE